MCATYEDDQILIYSALKNLKAVAFGGHHGWRRDVKMSRKILLNIMCMCTRLMPLLVVLRHFLNVARQ